MKLYALLREDFETWRAHYQELARYILPRHGRYLVDDTIDQFNDGRRKGFEIYNSTATDAVRIFAAGMHGGLTHQSKPWFRMSVSDPDLAEYKPHKLWFDTVDSIMRRILAGSNYYTAIISEYLESPVFGTGLVMCDEDFNTVARYAALPIGSFYMSTDINNTVDMVCSRMALTATQMADYFGVDKLSQGAKNALNNKNNVDRFEVLRFVHANKDKIYDVAGPRGMDYESVYFEKAGNEGRFLRKSGYFTKPFVDFRYYTTTFDVYASSPGMDFLGDVKQLQTMEEKKLKALAKSIDPPLTAPAMLKGKGVSSVPGGVTYYDQQHGGQGMAPVYQVRPDLVGISAEVMRVEQRIKSGFFNDLFLELLTATKRMTATEVAQRYGDRLILLGPVIEGNLKSLDETLKRTFDIGFRMGVFPPPPPSLQGQEYTIIFISTLAQAQKLVSLSGIEQLSGYVTQLANFYPDVLDKFDAEESVDEVGESLGVPARIIRSDEIVAQMRAQREEQRRMQMMQQQLAQAADSAKTLSEARVAPDNLLGNIEGGA